MSKYIFGIDLGTTYSCIAYVDENGVPTVVKNMEGDNTTPSVVNFESPESVIAGKIAKENAVIDPDHTVSLVKTLMGRTKTVINYNGNDVSPQEVSSYILKKMTQDASQILNAEVKDVVITCPAYFGSEEREATRDAGELAGLNVIEILSEPTAAALYYGLAKESGQKTVLVYDLGGGTFDVTVLAIDDGNVKVVCSDGLHAIGGKNWDDALIDYLESEFRAETDFDDDFDAETLQSLRLKAEETKMQLTMRDSVPVMVDAAGIRGRVTVDRQTFDSITSNLISQTIEKTNDCIKVAEDKGYKIDEILLVGGSTRMPQVKEKLVETYGMEPKILEPDEAVAKGAAIYALLAYDQKHKIATGQSGEIDDVVPGEPISEEEIENYSIAPVAPVDVITGGRENDIKQIVTVATTKSYALKAYDNNNVPKCVNLIIKNQEMPGGLVSKSQTFATQTDNQETVLLEVYESDFMEDKYEVEEDFKLGDCTLAIPEGMPKGSPIEVTFTLNREGILEIIGREPTSGNEIKAEMQASAGASLTDEEIEEIKEKVQGIKMM
uniref:Hsp70 family protein n=1 Tax=Anaerococcus mediterraneensis TaxID=1870984 RepID=UPI000930C9EA|nr:Hsp70 family protein [Anaerococcus mediterraneensis]